MTLILARRYEGKVEISSDTRLASLDIALPVQKIYRAPNGLFGLAGEAKACMKVLSKMLDQASVEDVAEVCVGSRGDFSLLATDGEHIYVGEEGFYEIVSPVADFVAIGSGALGAMALLIDNPFRDTQGIYKAVSRVCPGVSEEYQAWICAKT